MPKDQIVLRWIVTGSLSDGDVVGLRALLSPDEKARANGFHIEADQIAYTAAHALALSTLAGPTQRLPLSWQVRLGPFGKPERVSEAREPEIGLSLSHTRGLAVVAASIGFTIGADVRHLPLSQPKSSSQGDNLPETATSRLKAL